MCGEQSPTATFSWSKAGSPPRVRGTVSEVTGIPVEDRITPACAGNSASILSMAFLFKDHPRVCGEQNHRPALTTP